MKAIPYAEIDTLFLDAGGTLVHVDDTLLRAKLKDLGVQVRGEESLARAEAAARPIVSEFLTNRSTEAVETRRFYLSTVLDALRRQGAVDLPSERGQSVADALFRWFTDPEVTFRMWLKVPVGVAESLTDLRDAGLRLVVVSNSDGRCEERLVACGLRPKVDYVVDSRCVGIEKPDPEIFRKALAVFGSVPERTLHVGDIYSVDVVGARAAGIHAVLVDPYDDWRDVDCECVVDVPTLARSILAAHER